MKHTETKLRIGFVTTMRGVAWGGSEELWSEAALRLAAAGHAVNASVLRWPERPASVERLIERGVALAFRTRKRGALGRTTQKILQRIAPGSIDVPYRQWLKRGRFDLMVISQGGPWDGIDWMLACRELRIPYCCIVQANSELWWPLDERLLGIKKALNQAKAVYFVSRANQRLMEMQCGMPLPHSEVVANPSRVDRGHASQVPWPDNGDGIYRMACVGRMTPSAKGQDILFEVLAQPKWRTRPLRVNLYGAGPSEESLKALARYLGLQNVCFAGYVRDVASIWADNHILVLPSRFEGLPVAIVEAMLCGRPVITTDIAGNAELIQDGQNGFIAAAPTASLLDNAMERAWASRERWKTMGSDAFQAALAAVPPDAVGKFAEKLLALARRHRSGGGHHEHAINAAANESSTMLPAAGEAAIVGCVPSGPRSS